MTQLQTMSDQELNRKLAELMGYTVRTYRNGRQVLIGPNLRIVSEKECFPAQVWDDAPEYCTDHAASLEVQEKAIEVSGVDYARNLVRLKSEPSDSRVLEHYPYGIVTVALTASPRERAEAAYMILQAGK